MPIDDVDKVQRLFHDFKIEQVKGKPPQSILALDKTGIIKMPWDDLERLSQDGKKFNVKFSNQHKNYESDTWGGSFTGKPSDLYRFFVEECLEDPDYVEDQINDAIENQDEK